MNTPATPMVNMGADLVKEAGTEHYVRSQWAWWRRLPDNQVRYGLLEDPNGVGLYSPGDGAAAIEDEAEHRCQQLRAFRREEISRGFKLRKPFVLTTRGLGSSGVFCRPNANDAGWHVSANNGTLYGRGTHPANKTPQEQLADLEDACMECAMAMRQSREKRPAGCCDPLTLESWDDLANKQVDLAVLAKAIRLAVGEIDLKAVIFKYNELTTT